MKNLLCILLAFFLLSGCAEMKKAALGKINMVDTTIDFTKDGESVKISSKPDAKVEVTRDKDGGILSVTVDNKEPDRPGLPERLAETLASKSTLVLGAGVDSVTQKEGD